MESTAHLNIFQDTELWHLHSLLNSQLLVTMQIVESGVFIHLLRNDRTVCASKQNIIKVHFLPFQVSFSCFADPINFERLSFVAPSKGV